MLPVPFEAWKQGPDKTVMPQDDQSDRYRAPALDRGLDILEVLATKTEGLTRSEIVAEMGVSASQIYRMIERLVARGYVTRLPGGDRYMLSMKLFLLGTHHPPLRRLIAAAQPLMDAFAAREGQSLHLVVPEGGAGVIVAQASPVSHWEFRARLGARLDLFSTGSGLTLLAKQATERRAETMGQWGINDGEARIAALSQKYQATLEAVRLHGHRSAPSAQAVGITDLSVPVIGPNGDAVAVVTCAFIRKPELPDAPSHAPVLNALLALARTLSFSNDRPAAQPD